MLDRLGILPLTQGVALVVEISSTMVLLGLILMAAGWWQIWQAREGLVTGACIASRGIPCTRGSCW